MVVKSFDRHVEEFMSDFNDHTSARIARTVGMLERCGHLLRMPYSKNIAPRLLELRTKGNPSIRIFYTFYRGEVLLLHAYIKKSQKIPHKELQHAMNKLSIVDRL